MQPPGAAGGSSSSSRPPGGSSANQLPSGDGSLFSRPPPPGGFIVNPFAQEPPLKGTGFFATQTQTLAPVKAPQPPPLLKTTTTDEDGRDKEDVNKDDEGLIKDKKEFFPQDGGDGDDAFDTGRGDGRPKGKGGLVPVAPSPKKRAAAAPAKGKKQEAKCKKATAAATGDSSSGVAGNEVLVIDWEFARWPGVDSWLVRDFWAVEGDVPPSNYKPGAAFRGGTDGYRRPQGPPPGDPCDIYALGRMLWGGGRAACPLHSIGERLELLGLEMMGHSGAVGSIFQFLEKFLRWQM